MGIIGHHDTLSFFWLQGHFFFIGGRQTEEEKGQVNAVKHPRNKKDQVIK